jgi:hypothetical protein
MIVRRDLLALLSFFVLVPKKGVSATSENPNQITAASARESAQAGVADLEREQMSRILTGIENRATSLALNCGWTADNPSLEAVRRYHRDVHAPLIARRPGIYQYQHYIFDPIRAGLFAPTEGIELDCQVGEQFSAAVAASYLTAAEHARSAAAMPASLGPLISADIPRINKRTALYVTDEPGAGHTFVDTTGFAVPQGPPELPGFGLFFRQRADKEKFREGMKKLAQKWSAEAGVRRLRLMFLKVGGTAHTAMENEHLHQAWIDLVIDNDQVARQLQLKHAKEIRPIVRALHAYPVHERYTYVYAGRPTLVGLRGYAAYQAIQEFGATNQEDPRILEWMYGPVAQGGPVEPSSQQP